MTTHLDHWTCAIGDTVADPRYWHPPLSHKGDASLKIVAFYFSLPRSGWTFERTALGQPWVRTA